MMPGFKGSRGVAAGELEASVTAGLPMGYEDLAPPRLLVTEAGGLVTDLDGNDVLTGAIVPAAGVWLPSVCIATRATGHGWLHHPVHAKQ